MTQDLARRYPETMAKPRGAGYWLWKPFILRETLANVPDGDLVLYTDAAMRFVADPEPMLACAQDEPIVLFELPGERFSMRRWTKRDCFIGLDADAPNFHDISQLVGGIQLYRAGAEARVFVQNLCAAMTVPHALDDEPNQLGRDNFPEFEEHRHDQSVLTIMARKAGLPRFPDPSFEGCRPRLQPETGPDGIRRPATSYGPIFDIHRKRGTNFWKWYARTLLARGPWR
ncbi:hypothetical protein ACKTEK_06995 [Tepidamorphus sp. 3E244]|uniref:hypothetical protein n=1 Tax=Tepidamorphus sp. 3E244 TaxID=3385498 RepID=UPI0038FBFB5C